MGRPSDAGLHRFICASGAQRRVARIWAQQRAAKRCELRQLCNDACGTLFHRSTSAGFATGQNLTGTQKMICFRLQFARALLQCPSQCLPRGSRQHECQVLRANKPANGIFSTSWLGGGKTPLRGPVWLLAQNEAVDPRSFEKQSLQTGRVLGEGKSGNRFQDHSLLHVRCLLSARASALWKACPPVNGSRLAQLLKIPTGMFPHRDFSQWTTTHARRPLLQEATLVVTQLVSCRAAVRLEVQRLRSVGRWWWRQTSQRGAARRS